MTINFLKKDSRIDEISDERPNDGIWVYLKTGWSNGYGNHIIHEDTEEECFREMRYIEECSCKDCYPNEGKNLQMK